MFLCCPTRGCMSKPVLRIIAWSGVVCIERSNWCQECGEAHAKELAERSIAASSASARSLNSRSLLRAGNAG